MDETNMTEFMGGGPDAQMMEMVKVVKDLMSQGMSRQQAIAAAMQQMMGAQEGAEMQSEDDSVPMAPSA